MGLERDRHPLTVELPAKVEHVHLDGSTGVVERGAAADVGDRGAPSGSDLGTHGVDPVGRYQPLELAQVGGGKAEIAPALVAFFDHAAHLVGAPEQPRGHLDASFGEGGADPRAAHGDVTAEHRGDLLDRDREVLLQVGHGARTTPTEAEVVAEHQPSHTDSLEQVPGGEGRRIEAAELAGERLHDHEGEPGLSELLESLLQALQAGARRVGAEHLLRGGVEGEGGRRCADLRGQGHGSVDQRTMPEMDAVEVADGEHGAERRFEVPGAAYDLHRTLLVGRVHNPALKRSTPQPMTGRGTTMSSDSEIGLLLRQRELRRLRATMLVALLAELWVLPQVVGPDARWVHGALVLPVAAILAAIVAMPRFQRVAAPLAAIVVGLVASGWTASLAWVDEPAALLVGMAVAAVALPSATGLGVRLGGVMSLAMVTAGAALLLQVGGVSNLVSLVLVLVASVALGVLIGHQRRRIERADLRAKADLQHARNTLLWQMHTDPLTGLPNRGYVQEWLQRMWEQNRRSRGHLSVMVVDVDHFKNVNDRYGHAVGDDVLRNVGRALLRSSGPTDLVGRWGGEEFVVVLENCAPERVPSHAEALRRSVESSRVVADGEDIRVTVSIGSATWDAQEELSPEELFVRADRALYVAKETGRNRVINHEARPA